MVLCYIVRLWILLLFCCTWPFVTPGLAGDNHLFNSRLRWKRDSSPNLHQHLTSVEFFINVILRWGFYLPAWFLLISYFFLASLLLHSDETPDFLLRCMHPSAEGERPPCVCWEDVKFRLLSPNTTSGLSLLASSIEISFGFLFGFLWNHLNSILIYLYIGESVISTWSLVWLFEATLSLQLSICSLKLFCLAGMPSFFVFQLRRMVFFSLLCLMCIPGCLLLQSEIRNTWHKKNPWNSLQYLFSGFCSFVSFLLILSLYHVFVHAGMPHFS